MTSSIERILYKVIENSEFQTYKRSNEWLNLKLLWNQGIFIVFWYSDDIIITLHHDSNTSKVLYNVYQAYKVIMMREYTRNERIWCWKTAQNVRFRHFYSLWRHMMTSYVLRHYDDFLSFLLLHVFFFLNNNGIVQEK